MLQMRTSVNSLAWTPEGRRCITGTQSGEFTLWNGTQFNFETIIQVTFCKPCRVSVVNQEWHDTCDSMLMAQTSFTAHQVSTPNPARKVHQLALPQSLNKPAELADAAWLLLSTKCVASH